MKTYDLQQAAEILHMSSSALRLKIKQGVIRAAKPAKKWVIRDKDIEDYLTTEADLVAQRASSFRSNLECPSTSAERSGGLISPHPTAREYAARLGLVTEKLRRSTTTD
ncbi:MAG: helix-turn-helix domain-containing protein [Gammaproteobacteria bacterium]|nr:helix-turn-helix domain-containing protein [Gammaproteobacteria bacterium]